MRIAQIHKRTSAWIGAVDLTACLLVFFFLAATPEADFAAGQGKAFCGAAAQCRQRILAGKTPQSTALQLRAHERPADAPVLRILHGAGLPRAVRTDCPFGKALNRFLVAARHYGCVIAYNLGGNSPPQHRLPRNKLSNGGFFYDTMAFRHRAGADYTPASGHAWHCTAADVPFHL